MKFEVDPKIYEEIENLISSDESPVGIDAKKTHVLILNKLFEISDRVNRIEHQLKIEKGK